MSSLSRETLQLAGAVVAGGVLATLLAHILPCPFPLKSRTKGAYVLAVFLKIKPGTLAIFKEKWAEVAKVSRSSAEPNCLSYELSVSTESEEDLIIYERYVTKADLDGPHRASPQFKAFGKWLNEEVRGVVCMIRGARAIVAPLAAPTLLRHGRAAPGTTAPRTTCLTLTPHHRRAISSSPRGAVACGCAGVLGSGAYLAAQCTPLSRPPPHYPCSNKSYIETNVGHMLRG